MKFVRVLHRYLGAFTAPAVLFFAFTGALQTLSLHDAAKDGHYQPPTWLVSMAQLHKKQTLHVQPKKAAHVEAAPNNDDLPAVDGKHNRKEATDRSTPNGQPVRKRGVPMKAFFVLVSFALILSTVTGLQTAWAFTRQRRIFAFTVIAGILVPVALLFL
jgi:hypothetical protein